MDPAGGPTRYLVLLDQALRAGVTADRVASHITRGDGRAHIVVPATRQRGSTGPDLLGAWAVAQRNVEIAVDTLQRLGVDATGGVGDEAPVAATLDALHQQPCHAVIVLTQTPMPTVGRQRNVPEMLRRRVRLPLIHLVTNCAESV